LRQNPLTAQWDTEGTEELREVTGGKATAASHGGHGGRNEQGSAERDGAWVSRGGEPHGSGGQDVTAASAAQVCVTNAPADRGAHKTHYALAASHFVEKVPMPPLRYKAGARALRCIHSCIQQPPGEPYVPIGWQGYEVGQAAKYVAGLNGLGVTRQEFSGGKSFRGCGIPDSEQGGGRQELCFGRGPRGWGGGLSPQLPKPPLPKALQSVRINEFGHRSPASLVQRREECASHALGGAAFLYQCAMMSFRDCWAERIA
jgi:hypothetical protein